jgi:hypothetical protein
MTTPLPEWESFYVIVGSSAGALTGLQFVVMALVADLRRNTTSEQIDAFGTPNIVHFCAVLLLSAVLSAPWPTLTGPDWVVGVVGLAGIVYVGIVFNRARRQEGYVPVFEDWLWHVALPFIAYLLLIVAAIILSGSTTIALFTTAAMSLLLMFVGIHNAWDTVTFIVVQRSHHDKTRTTALTEDRSATEASAAPTSPSA